MNARQEMIQHLIQTRKIHNQAELLKALREEGFPVAQATISRDIRTLHLTKKADSDGSYHYVSHESSFRTGLLFSNIHAIDYAGNIVVIKCSTGTAQAVCTVLDGIRRPEIVGTLAGDDTIFVLARTEKQAHQLAEELNQKVQNR